MTTPRLFHTPKLRTYVLAGLVALAGTLITLSPWAMELEERWTVKSWGLLRNALEGVHAPDDIVIVTLERQSFLKYKETLECLRKPGGQPNLRCWPRSYYGDLLGTLKDQGTSLVVFNIFFKESREEEDKILAENIQRAGNVVLQEHLDIRFAGTNSEIVEVLAPIAQLEDVALASAPFPVLDTTTELLQFWTFISLIKTGQDVSTTEYRGSLPVVALHLIVLRHAWDDLILVMGSVSPELATDLTRHRDEYDRPQGVHVLIERLQGYFQANPEHLELALRITEQTGLLAPQTRYVKALLSVYRESASLYLNPYGPSGTITTIPFHQVSEKARTNSDFFRNKIVFLGPSLDIGHAVKGGTVYTSFDEISSVELLATVYANLVENRFLHPLGRFIHIGLLLAWGFLLTAIAGTLSLGRGILVLTILSFAYGVIGVNLFRLENTWLPVSVPIMQVVAAFLVGLLFRYLDQQRRIGELIKIKIPFPLGSEIGRPASRLTENGIEFDGICLITDGQGYTRLGQEMGPAWLTNFMMEYQPLVENPVRQHGGIIQGWAGDGMMALWLVPKAESRARVGGLRGIWNDWRSTIKSSEAASDHDIRAKALDAALSVSAQVERFTHAREVNFPIRIGVNFGPMEIVVRGELKAFGDTINTTQRLENLNKILKTRILISDLVAERLNDYAIRRLGSFELPGREGTLQVHELLGTYVSVTDDMLILMERFAEAMDWFEKGNWRRALKAFAVLREDFPNDGPTEFFVQACRERLRKR